MAEAQKEVEMSKHPLDHDHDRDEASVAKKYAQIEREQADQVTDPKVRAMTKAGHSDEEKSLASRIKKFLKIDRQRTET